ncbi:thiamine-monophosphate kinase [Saccharothrix coeruleofusca]|uniref:thiamine-phosphate kinase n=1 Tax=Saccharothrix coeruleofusca TaxID=33919 RepID=UPI001AEBA33A|nr:thiamine-phosphate kinase [Saccharothrix coeruleofusca]MBP2340151.1 thiamine-monophosphate kinase [Saccharothrix coeruleofusca]
MASDAVFSDEPTRLRNIIVRLFGGQADAFAPPTAFDHGRVELIAGADAQDDCAVFRLSGDLELVVGSDYVRGPKFRLYEMGHLNEYDLGYYLVVANVSDIAAMGARPIGVLSVVRYPPNMSDAVFSHVMTGIRDACASFGCLNIGGDIGSAERLILSASALGVCPPGRSLLRAGARPGDAVCLTAPTGLAGAAMAYSRAGIRDAEIESSYLDAMLASWRRPTARVAEGVILSSSGAVTSCQDTSDGLKATLESIAAASGVGITVEERSVPIPEAVGAVASRVGADPLALVMGDSVDFELVFTVPEPAVAPLTDLLDFHRIGLVTEERSVALLRSDGNLTALPGQAWRHAPEDPGTARRETNDGQGRG